MYRAEVESAALAAKKKFEFLKENPVGYFSLAMMAGFFVGITITFVYTVYAMFLQAESTYGKFVMGLCFGIALSLVLMAGAELFTGSNFVMVVGMKFKYITFAQTLLFWAVCWLGNFVGSAIIALIFHFSGLQTGMVAEAIASACLTKTTLAPQMIFLRGILCNFLVCIAVWCGIKMKSESGKLIMTFWCLLAFSTSGFEHCVANMSLLVLGLLDPAGQTITVGGVVYNLAVSTIGNILGGAFFVAVPYLLTLKKQESTKV